MRWLVLVVMLAACSSSEKADSAAGSSAAKAKPAADTSKPTYGAVFPAGTRASKDDVKWTELDYTIQRGRVNPMKSTGIELSVTSGQLLPDEPLEAVVVLDDAASSIVVSYIWVYALRDGAPALLDTVAVTRQKNVRQIYGADIEEGALEIERLFCEPETPDDSINCPREVQVELWKWDGSRFVEDVAKRAKRVP